MKFRNLVVASAAILMVLAFPIAEPASGKKPSTEPQPQTAVVRDANGALIGAVYDADHRGRPRLRVDPPHRQERRAWLSRVLQLASRC
jgi:hypothetical protein